MAQQGILSSCISYYDLMVIGITGQGKSTATDKLLVASLPDQPSFKLEDFSLWCINEQADEDERQRTRVKNLAFFSELEKPHEEINLFHESHMKTAESTKECEVISNEKTKLRVLDVPGFYDKDSISATSVTDAHGDILRKNLVIMRRILLIQTAKSMCFRRVLYFLPHRGPLERANAILQLELKLIVHYFGLSFLKSLVLVATVRKRYSKDPQKKDEELLDEEERKETLDVFSEALHCAFPDQPQAINEIKPPLILLRLSDTCEKVLEKVQTAEVANDQLKLELNPNTCGKCGMKIGTLQGGRDPVVCYQQQGAIPYTESKCHPLYRQVYPLKERVKRVLSFGIYKPLYDEMCACCQKKADSPPCMKIGEEFHYENKPPIKVDHENAVRQVEVAENQLVLASAHLPDGPSLQVGLGYQGEGSQV